MLIVVNCVRDLEPRKVINSQNSGPYTFKTLLRWCIKGPIGRQDKSKNFLYPALLKIKVKDNSIENLLQTLHEKDFVNTQLEHSQNRMTIYYGSLSKRERSISI